MAGERSARRTGLGRLAVGLLAAVALVLAAPIASATPQADADAAITAAWKAAGGDTGPLGPKDGDVYPAGDGFGQNFPGGKIFFTPATGAHVMTGAILDKYMSLGGPADSDLGFPTIDEGAGKAPGSRNTTFSAADNPVIFWTPDTGARVVRGPINVAWDTLGGSAGQLGVPADDETYRGGIVTQKFTSGQLSYDSKAKSFTTDPPDLAGQLAGVQVPDDPTSAINAARRAAGGPLGPLGAAQGERYKIGIDGLGQNFAGGKIFYSPATGADVVTGQVLAKYESVGGPQGDLGLPTSSEVDGGLANSRLSTFAAEDQPVIFWTPDYGAVIVRGAMNAAWQKLGGATGSLGAPMADQTEHGDVTTQRFSGGVVSYDEAKRAFSTEPANLASQLNGIRVPGLEAPKSPPVNPQASDTNGKKWFGWSWWWLLAIAPVLALVVLVAFAALRNRRSAPDDDLFDTDEDEELQASHDGDAGELFGTRYAQQGRGRHAGEREYPDYSLHIWGARPLHGDEPDPEVNTAREHAAMSKDVVAQDEQDDPDRVDTTPTRLPTSTERDPLNDTGRHARIEIDEPSSNGIALHLPLDDLRQVPVGYPIKADTTSGLYWVPGSMLYDEASAEIWFASEELARTNGFVRAN